MANWEDKFNKLASSELSIEGNKEWRFALEESKSKGTLQMNVRLFQLPKEEGGYSGPTKNGFIIPLNSKEDVENFQNSFDKFCEDCKKIFD